MFRKIQKVGERSFSISLPKSWVLRNKLNFGMDIQIDEGEDFLYLSIVKKSVSKTKVVINSDNLINLGDFIRYCYVRNIKTLILKSKKFDIKRVRKIKSTLSVLEGFDIVDESLTHIEISFMFENMDIKLHNLFLRSLFLFELMVDSILEKDKLSLDESENSIDKIYYLSKRVLYNCFSDVDLKKKNNLKNFDDVFFWLDIFKKIENMADVTSEVDFEDLSKIDLDFLRQIIYLLKQGYNKKIEKSEVIIKLKNMKKNKKIHHSVHVVNVLAIDMIKNLNFIDFDLLLN